MASTSNSSKDPKSRNHLSEHLMDELDDAVRKEQAQVFANRTLPASEHATLIALANAQGFEACVSFIYNSLPKEAQHGWNIRRTTRGPQGSLSSRPESGGGEGAVQSNSGNKKRRSPFKRPAWLGLLAPNRDHDTGSE